MEGPLKWIVLERDGVINKTFPGGIVSPEQWEPLPGALRAIGQLSGAGYRVAVVTMQPAISEGNMSPEDLNLVHERMRMEAATHGGGIDAIFYCPHQKRDECDCAFPGDGLLRSMLERLKLDAGKTPFVIASQAAYQAVKAISGIAYRVGESGDSGADSVSDQDPDALAGVFPQLSDWVDGWLAGKAGC